MCRFVAYTGPGIRLRQLLIAPSHSLVRQSWAPDEMQEARLNADGYGFGWYQGEQARRYRSTRPIWADANLEDLADTLLSELWLASVRSATPGQGVDLANTHPFRHGRLLFMHNGYLEDFHQAWRPRLHRELRPEIQAGIHGDSDSEFIFALLREYLEDGESPPGALLKTVAALADWQPQGTRALLNLLLSDGQTVYAVRHALGGESPSLYFHQEEPGFSPGRIIASERLSPAPGWQAVPAHRLLELRPAEPIQLTAL